MHHKKIFISFSILLLMIFSICLPVFAQDFSDLSQDYWAYSAIESLDNQNIITGYSDGTFKPDNPVTRAEFATMIIKALNQEKIYNLKGTTYIDIQRGFWAYDNIQKANSLGLIRGFPDSTFRSNAYISKAEVLTILANAARTGQLSTQEAHQIIDRFYDAASVPDWAVVSVARAVNAGLAVNYPQPNFLMPQKSATRADVAVMLFTLRKYLGILQ